MGNAIWHCSYAITYNRLLPLLVEVSFSHMPILIV
uniref:Uncharacterized protein n=1 Tax=Anguilla anguilla TaxID=7936 RepID=A0A0E9SE24_ANGAN